MQYKSIIIGAIGLLVLLFVGGAAWYLLVLRNIPTRPLNTTSSTDYGTGPQTSVNTTATTPTTGQQTLESQYTALFKKLSAQKISFNSVASISETDGDIYALITDDIASYKKSYPTETDLSVGVSSIDLNGDGMPEKILYEDLLHNCGTAGCILTVYQKQQGKWVPVLSTMTYSTVGLLSSKTSGYSDLLLTIQSAGYISTVERYSWDGAQYAPSASMAAWDGEGFKLAR